MNRAGFFFRTHTVPMYYNTKDKGLGENKIKVNKTNYLTCFISTFHRGKTKPLIWVDDFFETCNPKTIDSIEVTFKVGVTTK